MAFDAVLNKYDMSVAAIFLQNTYQGNMFESVDKYLTPDVTLLSARNHQAA